MKKVFLSFSFRDTDRELVTAVDQLLVSHDLTPVTGRRLAGDALTDAIKAKIEQSDAVIALLTRRDQLASGDWTTHDWVRDELNFGRGAGKRAIALLEGGVQMSGAYGEHERIHFNRDELLKAFLALSETLGLWKAQAGRLTKVRIMPETLARNPRLISGAMTLKYRYLIAGEFTPWKSVTPVPEVGSTVVYLPGVHDGYMIQLQLLDGANQWISPATPQLIEIELEQVAGGAG